MNLRRLRELQAEVQRLAMAMDEEIARAETQKDPLAALIYHSRQEYRRTVAADNTKEGKAIERMVHRRYIEATALGFGGDRSAWWELLRASPRER
jgi:hypothetical protein